MAELIRQAAELVPSAIRDDAVRVTFRLAAGYHATEIAAELGTKRRRVEQLRSAMVDGLCEVFAANGYTRAETIRTLGVPSNMVPEQPGTIIGVNGYGRSRIPDPTDA